MLQVARLAPKMLGEATDLVATFLQSQQNEDGGFKNRAGQSDLYYTVFGIDSLLALQLQPRWERLRDFLRNFGDDTDFVHTCCLIRARAALRDSEEGGGPGGKTRGHDFEQELRPLVARLARFRSADGGFNPMIGSEAGTAYGAFLGLGAYQDAGVELPERRRLGEALGRLETVDGAWTNERFPGGGGAGAAGLAGSTNATAAAVTVLRNLSLPIRPTAGEWLLARAHSQGGFLAIPGAPMPDLLSTATTLHALAGLEVSFENAKDACLDFLDSLWTNQGSFHGNWGDDFLDCEYTFYALLALGHLSL